MKIWINGIIRDMTPEEIGYLEKMDSLVVEKEDDPYNIIDILTGEEDADKNN